MKLLLGIEKRLAPIQAIALIGLLWLVGHVPAALAQTYCAQQAYPGNTNSVCFSTLAEAEAHIRAESVPVAGFRFLEFQSAAPLGNGQYIRYYDVPVMEPGSMFEDYYDGYLTGTPGPYSTCMDNRIDIYGVASYGCATEDQQVQYMLADYPYHNAYSGSVTGTYTAIPTTFSPTSKDPATNIAYVWAQYQSSVAVPHRGLNIDAPGGTIFNPITKHEFYPCPQGLNGLSTTSNPRGVWPKVCYRYLRSSIIYTPKNYASCHLEGPNPCAPATGSKLYVASEFEYSGVMFERTYSSSADFAPPSMGFPGQKWSHSFYSQVKRPNSDAFLMQRNGQIDVFRSRGSNLFESKTRAGVYLVLLDSGEWELHEFGRIDRFDASGSLIVGNLNGGVSRYTLDYCTSGEYGSGICGLVGSLQSVVFGSGRSLSFSYSERTIEDDTGRTVKAVVLDAIMADDGTSLVSYEYDTYGRLTSATNVAQQQTNYQYGEDAAVCVGATISCDPQHFRGYLTSVVDVDGSIRRYAYDAAGRAVHSEVGLPETATKLEYPAPGAAVAVRASGAHVSYTFQPSAPYLPISRTVTDTVSGDIRETKWDYDPNGRLIALTKPNGLKLKYFYDSATVTRTEDWSSTNTKLRSRTVTRSSSSSNPIEELSFDAAGTLQVKRTWAYNTRGQTLAVASIDPATSVTRTTTTTYCEQSDIDTGTCPRVGLVTSIDGPRTDVSDLTTYQYYAADHPDCVTSPTTCAWRKGDLWKVTDALGHVTETLRYDGAGRVLSVRDANDVVTDFEYHPRGWMIARKVRGSDDTGEADDRITTIDYLPTGLVSSVTLPDGSFTSYVYDAAHRLTDIVDADGNRLHYTLDNAGNRIKEEVLGADESLKRTLSRVYNQLGQLATQADAGANPTDFTYDANGNLETATDALDRVTQNDYDPLNRLIATLQDVGGIEAATAFEYDALDNLTKVTDPKGLDTVYTYNGFGDLTQLDSPDTGVTTYTYDAAGNRTGQTDARGETTSYGYDALNRLTSVGYSDSSLDVAYVYDTAQPGCATGETFAIGRLGRMSDGTGHTDYCYDRFGQLVRKVQVTDGQSFTLRYEYTKAGQLSRMTYPDGTEVDYVRDGQGRTTEIGVTAAGESREVLLDNATWYPFGPVGAWTFGNGRTLSRTLDLDYRPQSILSAGTGSATSGGGLDLGFGFDPVGNLTSLHGADRADPPRVRLDYDALSRLTAFRDGPTDTTIESYGYDATGNRTSFTDAGGTQAYSYPTDSHRLSAVAGVARGYDAVGNTTAIGTTREYVYNAANRLSAVKQGGAMTMNYGYNGRGERVHRHLGSDVTYSVYDEAGHWIGDYDASGAPKQQAIWLDDLPVGLLNGAATATNRLHYIEPDHLGTPRAVIEPQRDVAVWTWDIASEAFGNSAPSQDPDGDSTAFMLDMRFPGQRYDAVTGLNYNYFRDYEAGVGRYAQSDPIGQRGGVNTYGYVYQNPIKLIDPKGLDGSPFCGGATGLDESINFPGCIDTGGPVSSAEDTACDNCIEYEVVRVLTRDEADRINTDRAHLNNFVTCPLVTLGAGRLGGALVGTAVATACNFSTTEYTRIVHEGDVLHVRVKICDDRPYEKEWSDYTTDWIEYR